MQQIQNFLDERQEYLKQVIKEKKQKLRNIPEGHLRICASKNKVQYYHRKEEGDFDGVYIKASEMELAKQLAQKDYDLQVVKACEKELNAIQKYESLLPRREAEEIYEKLHPARKMLITPICETDEEFIRRWEAKEYKGKEFYEDVPEFYTLKGERVRSKSEIIIADMLYQSGIPYRYEYPLYIHGFGNLYPDFTILDVRNRKEVLWEHFGMVDDAEYVENAMKKLEMYKKKEFFLGDGVIITCETKTMPLNSKMVESTIKHYLLEK